MGTTVESHDIGIKLLPIKAVGPSGVTLKNGWRSSRLGCLIKSLKGGNAADVL